MIDAEIKQLRDINFEKIDFHGDHSKVWTSNDIAFLSIFYYSCIDHVAIWILTIGCHANQDAGKKEINNR